MSFLRKQLQTSNGQALLIVVLIMVVGLTVTLSLVSRSIVNLKTSVDQTNSQQALAAAEAGVEQSIKNNASVLQQSFSNNASFSTTYTQVAGNAAFLANGGNLVSKNEGTYIWLSTYGTTPPWSIRWNGNLTIYWGDTTGNDSANPALEIAVISGTDPSSAVIKRYAIDSAAASRGNNFTTGGITKGSFPIGSRTFGYKYTLPTVITNGLLVRINPIYFSTYLGVLGSTPLPDQGTIITADGAAADTRRRITVFQGYPQLPAEFFPYSLLSP